MSEIKVTVINNGPYKVEGAIDLLADDGSRLETKKSTVFLCRCGASANKPFCDGQHTKIGFQAAADAVPASAE